MKLINDDNIIKNVVEEENIQYFIDAGWKKFEEGSKKVNKKEEVKQEFENNKEELEPEKGDK